MLGSCPVRQAQGVGCTDEAVQQIVANAKKVMIEYDAIDPSPKWRPKI